MESELPIDGMSHRGSPFIVVATGMRAEARIAERANGVRAIAGGGDSRRLEQELERAIAEGAAAVMSFGIAGGLARDLRPGEVIIAEAVIAAGERFETDELWRHRLSAVVLGGRIGTISGSDAAVSSIAAKAALHAETQALAVDMESHIAARLASQHRLPFAAIRVVADAASRALPPAALAGLAPDGGVNIAAVLYSLVRQPTQLPRLIGVAWDTKAAMAALLRCHDLAGPALGPTAFGARLGGADLG